MTQLDLAILDWMQLHVRCEFLDRVMPVLTALGNAGIFWILLTVVLLCTKRYRRLGVLCACSLVLDLVVCNLTIKPLVDRVRPFVLSPSAPELLVAPPGDASFPSGHTAASFAATSALYAGGSRLWIPAAVLSLLIAFSRLYLYVHYPSDVLAGMVLGTVLGFVARWLCLHAETWWKARPIREERKH